MTKRSFDLTLSVIGLLVMSPLFVLIAIVIKLESRGPVFFLQERVGRDFGRFWICKFRTMRGAPEDVSGFDAGDSSRVTRIGRVLRALKLDELPQIWNVLMGQMSLVGPRPEVPHFGDGLINSVDNRFDLTRFSRRKAPSLGAILRMYGFETCEV